MFRDRERGIVIVLILVFLFASINIRILYSEEGKVDISVSPSELNYVGAVGQTISSDWILVSNYQSTMDVIVKLTYVEEGGPFLNVTFSANLFVLRRAVDQIDQFKKRVYYTIEVLKGAEGVIHGSITVEAIPANQENMKSVMDKEEISVNVEVRDGKNLRIRVVDATGNPVSNAKVLLVHITDGWGVHVLEEMVSEEGILETIVAVGDYETVLSCEGDNIESSPKRFGVTEDTEILTTAYLLTMTPPSIHGIFEIGGTRAAIGMFDMMKVFVYVRNYYNTSKDVTLKVWILNSQSRKVSKTSIETTIPSSTTAPNRTIYKIALPPPMEGWWKDTYSLHARIHDEQFVYREKSSTIKIRMVVPWRMVVAGTVILAVAIYFLKKRKMKEKLSWWRRFWPPTIIVCSVLIIAQCILYLLGYIDLSKLCGGILVVFVAIPLTYGVWYVKTRYETSKTMQLIYRIAFIGTGGFVAWAITFFGGASIIWATGLPPPAAYLGPELSLIILFVVPWVVGGFIGYLVGKRRNFRPFM